MAYTGGYSPSNMTPFLGAPRAAKKSKPAKEKREPERKAKSSAPAKQKTLGPRLWNPEPRRSSAATSRPTPQRKPREPIKIGPTPQQMSAAATKFLGGGEGHDEPMRWGPIAEAQGKATDVKPPGLTGLAAGQQVGGQQPGMAPAAPNPAPPAPKAKPPEVSDGVRELLNDMNWKVPPKGKTTSMPKDSFEKGGTTKLIDHDYSVTEDEWDRIMDVYSTPEARAAGFIPPSATSKKVDDNTPLLDLEPEESAALTWEAYEALSTDQKAAVDFNTLLTDARQKDLKKKITLTGVDLTDYTKQVTEIFGEGRGSEVTAVNTVGLLDQLDMDVVGQDLDEYLSLERAIDTEELGDFKFSNRDVQTLESLATGGEEQTPAQSEQDYSQVRSTWNMEAVDTAGIQKAQQMIKTALQKPDAMTYDFDTLVYGPSDEMKGQPPMGFGDETTKWKDPTDADKNAWFQTGLQVLSAEDPLKAGVPAGQDPMSWLLGDLDAATQGDEKTRQEFVDYVANITSLVGQYGSKDDATMAAMINKRAGLGG